MQQDKNKNKQVRQDKANRRKRAKVKVEETDEETHVCTNKNPIKTQNFKT